MNQPDIKIELLLNDARNSYFLEDTTGLYSPTNLEGYGLPGGPAVNDVTTVTVTFTYTQLSTSLIYVFTVSSGTITACTISFAGSSPVSILSDLDVTTWPFTSANRFELTKDYGIDLPSLDDMVYQCLYEVEGTYLGDPFDYSTQKLDLMDVATTCCADKESVKVDLDEINSNYINIYGWLLRAHSATNNGLTDLANTYINRAKTLCDNLCDCGC